MIAYAQSITIAEAASTTGLFIDSILPFVWLFFGAVIGLVALRAILRSAVLGTKHLLGRRPLFK